MRTASSLQFVVVGRCKYAAINVSSVVPIVRSRHFSFPGINLTKRARTILRGPSRGVRSVTSKPRFDLEASFVLRPVASNKSVSRLPLDHLHPLPPCKSDLAGNERKELQMEIRCSQVTFFVTSGGLLLENRREGIPPFTFRPLRQRR